MKAYILQSAFLVVALLVVLSVAYPEVFDMMYDRYMLPIVDRSAQTYLHWRGQEFTREELAEEPTKETR